MQLKIPNAATLRQRATQLFLRAKAWSKLHPRKAAGAGLVAVVLVVLLARSFGKVPLPATSYYTVKRSDFLISIVEAGTVKAIREQSVRNEMEGTARIISIVQEGTNVHRGDLLVELDSSDLRERISQQEVILQNSQFAFVQAKENVSIQRSLADSNLRDSELKVEFAKSDLEKYKEGDWPQQTNVASAKTKISGEELARAKDRLNWTQTLAKKGYATKSELEADQLAVQRKAIELGQGEEDLRLMQKYEYPKRLRLLSSNVEQAAKELERLQARINGQMAQADADLESRQKTLDLQKTRLDQLKEQLELTKIYAPEDGLVIYASSMNPGSGVLIEEGATIRQKQELIKLPDVSEMMVEVRVHESHIQKIRPGLDAWVTIDSVPDRQFRGQVRKVGVLPDSSSRWMNPNLKVYATEVSIGDQLPDIKPGISGRAEIIITNLTGVLTVPIQAVTTVRGRQVCLVKRSSTTEAVPVEVGLFNDRLIEVKAGLVEGDQVLLSPLSASDNIDMNGSLFSDDGDTNNKPAFKREGEEGSRTNELELHKGGTNGEQRRLLNRTNSDADIQRELRREIREKHNALNRPTNSAATKADKSSRSARKP